MGWDWGGINRIVDNVLVTAGIMVLIVRQFIWRSAELRRMLRTPLIIIASGLAYLGFEPWGEISWVPGDRFLVAELGLVALTGTAMGHVTRFRRDHEHLQYKLTTGGVWLWVLFLGIRVGSFYLAAAFGANLADATGLILLSFGVNRLAAVLVVRRRTRLLLLNTAAHPVVNKAR